MKLRKLKLNEASKAELNEREMCRVLGYTSDGSHPCCSTTDPKPEFPEITPPPFWNPQDALCGHF
ncbi:TIGR04149 family rSAM-modified RiPP [Bacteroides fragilis]|uniref:TIGR04149 family rSAM-modified RiPP n=1 Tax=Bacteroides fragilis TaxID=817 RepID=UPI0022DF1589|nr:TIGR04149 family rSAM-modified RiPP [Bacteroides fragilis]